MPDEGGQKTMCFAKPYKIEKINNGWAQIAGQKKINLALVPQARAGDWLLVHTNLAVNVLTKKEAEEVLALTKACHHE